MFAKLFGKDNDQVLVKLEQNDDHNPEVRLYFEPEGLGVCSCAISFKDNDSGWDKAEKLLEGIDEKQARDLLGAAVGPLGLYTPSNDPM